MVRGENRVTRRQCLTLLAGAAATTLTPGFCRAESEKRLLRLAVSADTLAGANLADARTAYQVWIDTAFHQFGQATADVVPGIFLASAELIREVRQGRIESYVSTAQEFSVLGDLTDPAAIVVQDYLADGMEYLLLVHKDGPYKKLADLRGARLVSHQHRDMILLSVWLGTLLAASGLPTPDHLFASQTRQSSVTRVILPVFFRHADAACVARRDWNTAVELNPQMGRDLRILAVSPKVIPVAVGVRRNSNATARATLLDSLVSISKVRAGQQIASLFDARVLLARPFSAMKDTLEMVHRFEQLNGQQAGPRKGEG